MAGLATFFTWFITVLPQISAILVPIFQTLVSSGVLGAANSALQGAPTTPTGLAVGSGIAATGLVGLFNWIKPIFVSLATRLATPPPPPAPPTTGATS